MTTSLTRLHFLSEITETSFGFRRNPETLAAEEALEAPELQVR